MLVGCATPRIEVREQGVAGGRQTFELRGNSLASLQAQAAQLCPKGMEVMRQWQSTEQLQAPSGAVRRWTVDLVDPPVSKAQLQVVCVA